MEDFNKFKQVSQQKHRENVVYIGEYQNEVDQIANECQQSIFKQGSFVPNMIYEFKHKKKFIPLRYQYDLY